MKEKLVKISYYITVKFSKEGIIIANKQGNEKGTHLFDNELEKIYEEYQKWKLDT